VVLNPNSTIEILETLSYDSNINTLYHLINHTNISKNILEKLAQHENKLVNLNACYLLSHKIC